MQINGIGSNHGSDMHNVTNCMHEHGVSSKKGGASLASQSKTPNQQRNLKQNMENGMSLSDWVKNLLSGAKNLWGKIWGSTENGEIPIENSDTIHTDETGLETLATPMSQEAEKHVVSQASAIIPPQQNLNNNFYFSTIEDTGRQQETQVERIRVKFQNIAGQLTKHFSFSNKDAFQAKQEKSKEDLSRRSRYRKDDMEIDCVLTDESYLMDSYNKKGEYSTLATDKRNELGKSITKDNYL